MDAVKEFLAGIDWEALKTLVTDFVSGLDIEGFFNEIVAFVQDLVKVIVGE